MLTFAVDRQWLYPYYVIVILLLVLFFFGCASGGADAFPLDVRTGNEQGGPIEDVQVQTRP